MGACVGQKSKKEEELFDLLGDTDDEEPEEDDETVIFIGNQKEPRVCRYRKVKGR